MASSSAIEEFSPRRRGSCRGPMSRTKRTTDAYSCDLALAVLVDRRTAVDAIVMPSAFVTNTNYAEEYFSRTRRGEIGHYHHIAGAHLLRYAQQSSRREDHRRMCNGDQTFRIAGHATHKRTSPDFVDTGRSIGSRPLTFNPQYIVPRVLTARTY